MKVSIEVEVVPFNGPDNTVQLDQARNLIEAVAAKVSSRETTGEATGKFGSATFTVTPDAKPKTK